MQSAVQAPSFHSPNNRSGIKVESYYIPPWNFLSRRERVVVVFFYFFFFSILFIRSFDYSNKNSSTIFFPRRSLTTTLIDFFFYNPHENIECLELISKEIRIVLETRSRQKSGRIERRASRVSTSHFIDHFDRIVENGFPPRQTPSYRLL